MAMMCPKCAQSFDTTGTLLNHPCKGAAVTVGDLEEIFKEVEKTSLPLLERFEKTINTFETQIEELKIKVSALELRVEQLEKK